MSGISNTCLHRNWALERISDEIVVVNSREKKITFFYRLCHKLFNYGLAIHLPDNSNSNKKIKDLVNASVHTPFDVVWIDKGITINVETIKYIKRVSPTSLIVSYSPDNMALRHNQSQNFIKCIPFYDVHFTTKSYILNEMKRLGAKRTVFVNNQYEPHFHYPRKLNQDEILKLGGDIGFIGVWERERCNSILYLAENGLKVKVFGSGKWNEFKNVENLTILPGIFSEDYSKALQAFKISLCFLRKMNADTQTTRTMEIPASGGFLLAERTDEHLSLFEEGKEAEFFSTDQELLEKCQFYLKHEVDRDRIKEAGTLRCYTSGYSNEKSIKRMIDILYSKD
jgi:hypothetical protein